MKMSISNITKVNTQYQDMVLGVLASCRRTRQELADECEMNIGTVSRFFAGKAISHLSFLKILKTAEAWEIQRESSLDNVSLMD